ncbi:MAG: hypothetical protein J6T24_01290, partial [Clostridia bacterium]|nr:hypothetical protein [Clostridia bacterium]
SVFVSRINYPMTVGVAEDGDVYFATTRLAFPEDVRLKSITLLPPMQTYELTRGGFRVAPYPLSLDVKVAEITEERTDAAYSIFLDCLKKKGSPLQGCDLVDVYTSVWPEGELNQNEPMLYVLLERLAAEGRLGLVPLYLEGISPAHIGKKFGVYLK